jgi:hypothetical protein
MPHTWFGISSCSNADDTVEVDGQEDHGQAQRYRRQEHRRGPGAGAGYLAIVWLMRRAERQLVQRFHVEPNIGEILRRWGQFVMVAVLFVFALNLVKIPLTLFAFLGGALAIGVASARKTC